MRCEDTGSWLDLLMDDALDAAQRQELNEHARVCPACAEQLRSTLRLKAMLEALPQEADVPLAAQAAWRNAVRQESKRRVSRRLIRTFSAVAAAAVVALGIGWALRPSAMPKNAAMMTENAALQADEASAPVAAYDAGDYELVMAEGAALEIDGVGAAKMMSAPAPATGAPMRSVTLKVSDAEAAARSIADTAAELEGETLVKTIEGVGAQIEVTLPAENAADFLLAVCQWDADPSSVALPELGDEDPVSLLLILET